MNLDLTTAAGVFGALVLLLIGCLSGEVSSVFLNAQGLLIVLGGTLCAMMLNTPLRYVRETFFESLRLLRRDPYGDPADMVPLLTRLSEQVQARGLGALRDVDGRAGGGFLQQASVTAMEYNNPEFVRKVLETEVNNRVDRANEVINVVRTAGVLSPMFGLIGTLLGIVHVLKQISDPEQVGPAMAVAVTTAFYGILLANFLFVPVAGKMRFRLWEEIKVKAMIIEGVVGMMQGTVPLVLERRLQSYR